jgi:hypothetical protein
MNRIAITSDVAYVLEPDGRAWLTIRRPFAQLPTVDELEALNVPRAGEILDVAIAHVAERRGHQASVAPEHRDFFDCPYTYELAADGSLIARWEACGTTWEEIIAGIREAA